MFRSGKFLQAAWAVSDLNSAMKAWLDQKVGPFLTFDLSAPQSLYRGEPSPLELSIAIAQAGSMQIKLVEQRSAGPSAFRDVVGVGQSGFHHLMKMATDYDDELDELRRQGIVMATEGRAGSARWVYADTRAQLGCMVEICPDNAANRAVFRAVTEAAENWDGTNPIRPLIFDPHT